MKNAQKHKQTKLHSFIESLSNELLGYIINTTVQILIFPLIGFNLSFNTNAIIGAIHSAFGVVRIFILRRFFNYKFKKQKKRICFCESLLNIVIGTIISFTIQPYVFLLFGIVISTTSNLLVTSIYLIITLIRLYILRRFFHKHTKKLYKQTKLETTNESR